MTVHPSVIIKAEYHKGGLTLTICQRALGIAHTMNRAVTSRMNRMNIDFIETPTFEQVDTRIPLRRQLK